MLHSFATDESSKSADFAPRILPFGSDQLLWECCGFDASEAYPHGIPAITCGTQTEVTMSSEHQQTCGHQIVLLKSLERPHL